MNKKIFQTSQFYGLLPQNNMHKFKNRKKMDDAPAFFIISFLSTFNNINKDNLADFLKITIPLCR